MSKLYVDVEQLEDVLREYIGNPSEVIEKLDAKDVQEIASSLSVHEKRRLLDSDSDVFAMQIWQRDDVIAAFRGADIPCSSDMVDSVMTDVRSSLEDCSDGWEKIGAAIKDCMSRPGTKLE